MFWAKRTASCLHCLCRYTKLKQKGLLWDCQILDMRDFFLRYTSARTQLYQCWDNRCYKMVWYLLAFDWLVTVMYSMSPTDTLLRASMHVSIKIFLLQKRHKGRERTKLNFLCPHHRNRATVQRPNHGRAIRGSINTKNFTALSQHWYSRVSELTPSLLAIWPGLANVSLHL